MALHILTSVIKRVKEISMETSLGEYHQEKEVEHQMKNFTNIKLSIIRCHAYDLPTHIYIPGRKLNRSNDR